MLKLLFNPLSGELEFVNLPKTQSSTDCVEQLIDAFQCEGLVIVDTDEYVVDYDNNLIVVR